MDVDGAEASFDAALVGAMAIASDDDFVYAATHGCGAIARYTAGGMPSTRRISSMLANGP